MLTIRTEQMRAFGNALQATFHARILEYLRRRAAAALAFQTTERLLAEIAAACRRAELYGFEQESSYFAFVELAFAVAPQFDDHPRIHEILSEAHVPPDVRMQFLGEDITSAEWEEARTFTGASHSSPVMPTEAVVNG